MTDFRVNVGIEIPVGALTSSTFPHVSRALHLLAERGVSIWRGYASGDPLPGGQTIRSRSGAYMRSIHARRVSDFEAEVLSELPYARIIELGAPARDLKAMLNTSLKVRVSKEGHRYLIIPFRHGTPGTVGFASVMSDDTYALARAMAASRVIGMGQRPSGTGAYDIRTRRRITVPARKYHWGDRLTAKELAAAGVHGRERRRMAGMVRMQNPGAEGGSKHTGYLTFRVMSEKSSGWLVPPRQGAYPARTTAERLRVVARPLFEEAVSRDVRARLGVS